MKIDASSRITPAQRALTHVVLLVLAAVAMVPFFAMVSTSLKSDAQVYESAEPSIAALFAPWRWRWQNYPSALRTVPLAAYLENTLLLCATTVLGAVMSSAVVAYGFARLEFKGKGPLFLLMISTMALPSHVTMIPVFALFRFLGCYGTFLPLILPSFFGVPFYVFLLTQFYRTLPNDLAEAARIDGANEWRIFWQVILPLSKPALVTCALFQFLATWNDFVGPLLYLNDPSKYTLAYGLQQFMASLYGGRWPELMAGAVLFTIPIVLLFFFAQKTFVQGIATSGSKN
jgi:ABC-type glycerol-3-phosphate transport system permease component